MSARRRWSTQMPAAVPAAIPPQNAEPALPNGKRAPPRVRSLIPARQQEVEPPADDPGGKAPHRNLGDKGAIAALALPTATDDRHRGDDREHVEDAVGMYEEGPEMEPVLARARNGCESQQRRFSQSRDRERLDRPLASTCRYGGALESALHRPEAGAADLRPSRQAPGRRAVPRSGQRVARNQPPRHRRRGRG
jgi:hypothetical protein